MNVSKGMLFVDGGCRGVLSSVRAWVMTVWNVLEAACCVGARHKQRMHSLIRDDQVDVCCFLGRNTVQFRTA